MIEKMNEKLLFKDIKTDRPLSRLISAEKGFDKIQYPYVLKLKKKKKKGELKNTSSAH